jgi:hypothetical protein
MGGAISRTFSPAAARNMMSNANSATLKSALQNYIKAVNELNNNARTENKLISMMNNTRVGLTNSYKKRIANAIASIVAKAPRVAVKAAEAAAGAAPEVPAAAAVNNLTTRIKNLNNFMNSIKGANANAFFKAHKNAGRNVNRNINTNSKRNGGARYPNVLRNIKSRYSLGTAAEVSQAPVGPYGIGKLTGVTKMAPNYNNEPKKYINYNYIKSSIVNSPSYANNAAKIAAVLAYNPTLNWGQLKITAQARKNANMMRILNAVAAAPKPAPTAEAANTGEYLKSMFGEGPTARQARRAAAENMPSNMNVAFGALYGREERNVNAPYRANKVKLVRTPNNRTWKFVNMSLNNSYTIKNSNSNTPSVAVKANVNAKIKAASNALYAQAYGGVGGIGVKSGQWTVNKSVANLTNTNEKKARFRGINRAMVVANLNARSNKAQANRAKRVLNAILASGNGPAAP